MMAADEPYKSQLEEFFDIYLEIEDMKEAYVLIMAILSRQDLDAKQEFEAFIQLIFVLVDGVQGGLTLVDGMNTDKDRLEKLKSTIKSAGRLCNPENEPKLFDSIGLTTWIFVKLLEMYRRLEEAEGHLKDDGNLDADPELDERGAIWDYWYDSVDVLQLRGNDPIRENVPKGVEGRWKETGATEKALADIIDLVTS